ncbi:MAG: hypothetical protein RL418_50 [Actinomycetota bacterium]
MLKKLTTALASIAVVASAGLLGPAAVAGETVSASGATYTAILQKECTAAYTEHTVVYAGGGSGTGKSQFAAGIVDWAGTDSLYAAGTAPKNFVYIPIIGGPIVLMYNIPGVTRLNLTPEIISGIYKGTITKWNDAKIVAANKTAKLPNETIQGVYRSDNSGTSNNFANYLYQTVSKTDWKVNDSFATAKGNSTGIGAAKASGVTATVKSTLYSIGYADLADAQTSGLPTAYIKNGAGQFIAPKVNNANKFLAAQLLKSNGQVVFDYKKKVSGGYPIVLVSYALGHTKSSALSGTNRPAKVAAAKAYLSYFVNTCAPAKAAALGYVPLSGSMLKAANVNIAKIK